MGPLTEDLWAEALADLRGRWPDLPWDRMRRAHGAFHEVAVLPPSAVVRIDSSPGHVERSTAQVRTADVLGRLGLPVPQVLRPVVHGASWSAHALSFVDGEVLEPTTWARDRAVLCTPLLAFTRADPHHPTAAHTRWRPRAWCGGSSWPERAAQLLSTAGSVDGSLLDRARSAIHDVLHAESEAEPRWVHGDFGPHNVLVTTVGDAAVIDVDHAAIGDPAIDVAPLLNHYPATDLAQDLGASLVRRARVHHRTLPLQVAVAADLAGLGSLRDHALGRGISRLLDGGS